MRRRDRILLTMLTASASVAFVLALVYAGGAGEGPIATLMLRLGGGVSRAESRIAHALRGQGRADSLAWLAPMRDSAAALANPDSMLLGVYDDAIPASLDGVLELERALGTRLVLIQAYTAWGDRPDQRFPRRIADAIADIGSIPVITWEPWLTDFENRLHPDIPLRDQRDRNGLADVAAGRYDFYIDAWAQEAARFPHTVLLRFAHEFNDPYRYPWGPQNNGTEDFIAAWRHVVDRFRAAGADKVVWVWSPHVAYDEWWTYYPGSDYVDWVATGALNYGTVASWSKWWTFDEIFGRHYDAIAALGKPVMIAEFGSIAVGGDRAAWYADALDGIRTRYPLVRAALLFHVRQDNTVTYQSLDWSLTSSPEVLAALRPYFR